jgi:hypothetical protein
VRTPRPEGAPCAGHVNGTERALASGDVEETDAAAGLRSTDRTASGVR